MPSNISTDVLNSRASWLCLPVSLTSCNFPISLISFFLIVNVLLHHCIFRIYPLYNHAQIPLVDFPSISPSFMPCIDSFTFIAAEKVSYQLINILVCSEQFVLHCGWFRKMWGVSSFLTISLLPCARYMNALEAGITEFSEILKFKDILRTPELLKQTVKNPNRKSNGKEGLRLHCHCKWAAFSRKSNPLLS